jgi:purine-binding chemotaxis protein CheW
MSHSTPPSPRGGQYLTCWLGPERYGLEVLRVREIIGVLPITPLPHSLDHILGVVNLRGRVIPVADLRTRLGMPFREPSAESCVIVVELDIGDKIVAAGLLVDEVADVCHVEEEEVVEPPHFDGRFDATCLLGLGRVDGDVVFLLDISKALAHLRPDVGDPSPLASSADTLRCS